ncbi:MAG: TonB C-terminal domain-containing protein [Acidobacteria bacterium]|nr:TonB C-terminal domain-containing protein [Acidobacteriota bacterium]
MLPKLLTLATCLVFATSPALVAPAAPQLKVYFAADFKDAVYQQKTYRKVASSWRQPADTPDPGRKAVVIAVIQKDGTIPEPALHSRSGSEAWDAAALEAVRKAAPFDALPKSYPRPTVEVHFHFEFS